MTIIYKREWFKWKYLIPKKLGENAWVWFRWNFHLENA